MPHDVAPWDSPEEDIDINRTKGLRRRLLRHYARFSHWDPNGDFILLESDRRHPSGVPLFGFFYSVAKNLVGVIATTLDMGLIDINVVDAPTGMSALHIAVGCNYLEMATLLISRGAALFPDARGRWPSIIAIECKVSDEMLDLVLDAESKLDDDSE